MAILPLKPVGDAHPYLELISSYIGIYLFAAQSSSIPLKLLEEGLP
jgi:hypothetical protein